ncbi:MAG: carbon-nitrogen hydrolase family protein, partial [Acetatifactor sp.]|nr:carbon-nitrogen hydrolase family protein [Acetatifactor sp.]
GPEGIIGAYQKIHLPYPEFHWATRGEKPFMFETPWGLIGVGICYDSYSFPELMRYYAAKGCRIYINSTAYAKCHGEQLARLTLEAYASINEMYIVSSNLVGVDVNNDFWGGSSILGPDTDPYSFTYYAGYPFADKEGIKPSVYTATIDLGLAKRGEFEPNKDVNDTTDFRPILYSTWMDELLTDEKYCE